MIRNAKAMIDSLDVSQIDFEGRDQEVWDLVGCMFDPIPEFNDYVQKAIRLEQISKWLQDRVNYHGNEILQLIMTKQLGKACTQLIQKGDYEPALCLAQVGGPSSATYINGAGPNGIPGQKMDPTTNDLLVTQIKEWSGSKSIPTEKKIMWALISGDCDEWDDAIPLCKTWYSALGLFVWYAYGGVSLEEALEIYQAREDAVKPTENGNTCIEYLLMEFFIGKKELKDVLKLSSLYKKEEYRLLWTMGLYFNLRYPGKINVDSFTRHFLAQLEACSEWQHCLFVACFLKDGFREEEIKRLLTRWYPLDDNSGSLFCDKPPSTLFTYITKELGIPAVWIHEARVIQARYHKKTKHALIALLDANNFAEAHKVLYEIVPKLILVSKFDTPFMNKVVKVFRENGWKCEWIEALLEARFVASEADTLMMKRAVEHVRSKAYPSVSTKSLALLEAVF